MTTVIFSLGQLISSDSKKLESAFQSALANEGINIEGSTVWTWLKNYLPRLRLDQITLEYLCAEFNTRFTTSMPVADFTKHFNSMCTMDETVLARIAALNDFLNENPDIQFLLVSHTNVSHFTHIMDQLEHLIPNCREGIIDNTSTNTQQAQILFATSMCSQCEEHPDTLQWAINKLKMDLDEPIISFLKTVQHIDKATDFTYIPVDEPLNVDTLIEELNTVTHKNSLHKIF